MSTPPSRVEIIAHRGYSAAAPENTLAAIDAAADAGAPSVEWDVRVLACGVPVLFHDDTLERTTDREGEVDALRWTELCEADAGSWFSPRFAGERVPRLEEAMRRAGGRFERLYPEIKSYGSANDLVRIGRIVKESGMSGHTTYISMDWPALEQLREQDDRVRIGYIVEHPDRFHEALARAADDPRALLDPDFRILLDRPELADAARARGVELAVWTVNDAADADALAALGVTGFTTNEVERLLHWSRSRPEPAA